jgi:hypothetical protein
MNMKHTGLSVLLPANPTLAPRARSAPEARAKVLCAAVAAQMSDKEIAHALLTKSTELLSEKARNFLREIKNACAKNGASVAPTGSGRQHAQDRGGRIAVALKREAKDRAWREDYDDPVVEWALKKTHPRLWGAFQAVSAAWENTNDYTLGEAARALAEVGKEFCIDHKIGQLGRAAARAIRLGYLTPDEIGKVEGNFFYPQGGKLARCQCNQSSLVALITESGKWKNKSDSLAEVG